MTAEQFDQAKFQKQLYESWEKTMTDAMNFFSNSPLVKSAEGKAGASVDPSGDYKKLYAQWESTMSEALDSWIKTPLFSSVVGQAIEKSSEFKKYLDEGMERNLKSMQLPTKSDINLMLTSINKIEEKINDLMEKVEDLKAMTG